MSIHWLWPAVAGVSFVLTWRVLRFAREHRLLDIPNERSSHDRPVPRGGGIAIFVAFMAGMLVAMLISGLPRAQLPAMAGGTLVAAIGLIEDYRGVSAGRRMAMHTVAALLVIYWTDGLPDDLLPGVPVTLINALGVLCTVWLINLYNFMDGIDGIASVETMTVCSGGIVLYVSTATDATAWILPAMLLASTAGFLVWNFPAARLFLGDSGSGFLGFMMAVSCIQAAQLSPELFWAWIILLGVFITDSGVTLGRRIGRRERLVEAHRSHAYQIAARNLGRHVPVTLAVGAINLAWLLPLAILLATGRLSLIPALLIAYTPLFWLAIHFKAGAAATE